MQQMYILCQYQVLDTVSEVTMHYKYKQNNYKYKFCRCVVCYRRCQRLQCTTNTNTNRTNTNTNQTNTNTNQTNTNQTNENQTITNTNMYIFCRCEGSYRQCQRLQSTTGFIPSPHAKLHCLVGPHIFESPSRIQSNINQKKLTCLRKNMRHNL